MCLHRDRCLGAICQIGTGQSGFAAEPRRCVRSFFCKRRNGQAKRHIGGARQQVCAHIAQTRIWFDGKTEWALAQGSGEVNVTTPSAGEVASINPMNFVYLYKRGYNATVADKGTSYEVHLVATNAKNSIKEAYVMVAKSSNLPYQVRIRTGASSWTTISISGLQVGAKKGDAFFRFNAKDFPKVDVVDLR